MEEVKLEIPRTRMSAKDSEKLAYLMKHHYLELAELVKFLIRKEYDTITEKK
jgi:hypothetical protein